MCLAVPMQLEEVDGDKGIVTIGGAKREIGLHLLPDSKIGDFVLVHAGFAIQKIDEKEAMETLELFRQMERLA
ncbi:HypC/HybG/HupF family hydrogenase formation chaperone [bacterium]|nr:HypC/HybG/HupF family hydrogenase formation chaperone [bacterium]